MLWFRVEVVDLVISPIDSSGCVPLCAFGDFIEPAELAHSLARVPVSETESAPASIVGAIAEVLAQGPGVEKTEATR